MVLAKGSVCVSQSRFFKKRESRVGGEGVNLNLGEGAQVGNGAEL